LFGDCRWPDDSGFMNAGKHDSVNAALAENHSIARMIPTFFKEW
jgi:hypothetical protein